MENKPQSSWKSGFNIMARKCGLHRRMKIIEISPRALFLQPEQFGLKFSEHFSPHDLAIDFCSSCNLSLFQNSRPNDSLFYHLPNVICLIVSHLNFLFPIIYNIFALFTLYPYWRVLILEKASIIRPYLIIKFFTA